MAAGSLGGAGAVRFFLGRDVSPDGAFFRGATPDIEDEDEEEPPVWATEALPPGAPAGPAPGGGAAVRGEGGRETLSAESPRMGREGIEPDDPEETTGDGFEGDDVDDVDETDVASGLAPPRGGPGPFLGPEGEGPPGPAGDGRERPDDEDDDDDDDDDDPEGDPCPGEGAGRGGAGAIPWGWWEEEGDGVDGGVIG